MKSANFNFFGCIIIIVLALYIQGCGGSTSGTSGGAMDNGVVKFKMDGINWISAPPGHPELGFEEEAITDGSTMVRVEAFAANGSHLALTVYNASGVGPGTYRVTDPGMRGFYKDDFSQGEGYLTNGMQDNPGTITITEMTEERVAGTFNFPMRNSGDPDDVRQITEGSFDLKFTYH